MLKDKYAAIWLSHSSTKDYLACPKGYFYKNIFKNPKTGRKIAITKPPLALGQAIHMLIDELANVETSKRFDTSLKKRLDRIWTTVSGRRGGFQNDKTEQEYKDRALHIIDLLEKHPGPLATKMIRLKDDLPYYWFSEEENMILCGKIDWMEYLENSDSVHIIDFKTGKVEEKADSLQLPIYYLLAKNVQKRTVSKMSYWYLDKDTKPRKIDLPDEEKAYKKIMEVAARIKLARQLSHFKCAKDEKEGCIYCAPLKAVTEGKGEFVRLGGFGEEVYILHDKAVSL